MARNGRKGFRESIIQTSMELGMELGEEGLTMRGIAARLGVSATALYQHFDSKASILQEICVQGTDLLWQMIEPKLSSDNPIERLKAINYAYVQFSRDNPWIYSLMVKESGGQMEFERLPDDQASRPLRACAEAIRAASRSGQADAEIDAQRIALQMWAANHGLCSLISNGGSLINNPRAPIDDLDAFIKSYISSIVSGLLRAV